MIKKISTTPAFFLKRILTSSSTKHFSESKPRFHDDDMRSKILKTSLLHVNRIGWNDRAIVAACEDLGLSPASGRVLTNGIMDVIEFAMKDWNEQMSYTLSEQKLEDMALSHRVREGIKIRLSYEIPYINTWHQAMAIGLHPANVAKTTGLLWDFSDEVWYIAGDRSIDIAWYYRRALLLAAYSTTELYMLTDRSDNFGETWNFLDRRVEELLEVSKAIHNSKNIADAIFTGLSTLGNIFYQYPNNVENDIEKMQRKRREAREQEENLKNFEQGKSESKNKNPESGNKID